MSNILRYKLTSCLRKFIEKLLEIFQQDGAHGIDKT